MLPRCFPAHQLTLDQTCTCYSMCMAILERRVQILFDPSQYAALEAEAAAQRRSVAAIVREAVDERLRIGSTRRLRALDRLFARADRHPSPGPIDWEKEKDSFERESVRDIP